MTTPLITDTDAPHPDAPAGFVPRLSGRCACCGQAETRSLFAMGHDARFRGQLQRALAGTDANVPPNWNNRVDWWIDGTCALRVTITDALSHIATLIRRDWTDKVVHGASRLTRRTVSAPPLRPHVPSEGSDAASSASPPAPGAFEPAEARVEQRMDELMQRLNRPMAGKWGWLTTDDGSTIAGRVLRTHPDPEMDPHAWRFDVRTVEGDFENCQPDRFQLDEFARNSA